MQAAGHPASLLPACLPGAAVGPRSPEFRDSLTLGARQSRASIKSWLTCPVAAASLSSGSCQQPPSYPCQPHLPATSLSLCQPLHKSPDPVKGPSQGCISALGLQKQRVGIAVGYVQRKSPASIIIILVLVPLYNHISISISICLNPRM